MLVTAKTWCERLAGQIPDTGDAAAELSFLKLAISKLEENEVKFGYLPHPVPNNVRHALGAIKNDAGASFGTSPELTRWIKKCHERAIALRRALEKSGFMLTVEQERERLLIDDKKEEAS